MRSLLALLGASFVYAIREQSTPQRCPPLPRDIALRSEPALPDPFTTLHGQHVRSKAQWSCRAQELSALFQKYELGALSGPPSSLGISLPNDGSSLTMMPIVGDRAITYTVNITLPTSGRAPFPAVIAFGAPSIPVPSNIATIVFDNSEFAQQDSLASRGKGLFYDLHGPNATASALTAWAWGVGRIIDALEKTPQAHINPRRLAITGCSRNGKGALVTGALEPRIALTIPQESGSGGAACWRLSDYQLVHNESTQTASEIVDENVWESVEFRKFANSTDLLPFDHHELAGLVAPRGLIVIDNSDYLWLGPWSSWGCMSAGRLIYEALGVESNMGYSSVGNHIHCQFPVDRQTPDLYAFYDRFLLDKHVATDVFYNSVNLTLDYTRWVKWRVPRLY
ncbi:carbohydrate-binding module 1 [Oleoguttula sp. CCFEE 5521]